MNRGISAVVLALLCVLVSPAVSTWAQPARVFVAAQGSDSNPCTFAQPCRTFQQAHDTVAAGGEIDVLDPAGYGSVIINKAISIQGHGFSGIGLTGGATGITITAGATDAVNLTGLLIDGAGVGLHGITFNIGKSLTIEDCIVRNVNDTGIFFKPNASSRLAVSRTLIADAGNNAIYVRPTGSGTITAAFNRVETHNNGSVGIYITGAVAAGGSVTAVATDSVAVGNQYGFTTTSIGVPTTLTLVGSVSTGNTVGGLLVGGAGATARLAESTVTENVTHGWEIQVGGAIETFGDNNIRGNGPNVGPPTLVFKQ